MQPEPITTNKAKHSSGNPLMRRAIHNLHHTVRGLFPLDVRRALEVGVGEGFSTADVLAGTDVVSYGGDLNLESVREARERYPHMGYAIFDATALPFPDGCVDLVYSLEVLEHIPQPERALHEMCRVSRRYVLISVPNEPVFRIQRLLSGKGLTRWGDHPEHVNHWSFWGIQRLLRANGLDIIAARSPFPFAWSVVLAQI